MYFDIYTSVVNLQSRPASYFGLNETLALAIPIGLDSCFWPITFVPDVKIGLDIVPILEERCSHRRVKSLKAFSLTLDILQQIKSI